MATQTPVLVDQRSNAELIEFLQSGAVSESWNRLATAVLAELASSASVLVRGTRIEQLGAEAARSMAAAFSALLGTPTIHSSIEHDTVWDVRPNVALEAVGGHANVSTSTGSCESHTDSVHRPQAEEIVNLWCYRQADSGGRPLLADLDDVLEALEQFPGGDRALRVLSTFHLDYGGWVGPVLAECPRVRFRPFLILKSLETANLGARAEFLHSVKLFERAIEATQRQIDLQVGDCLIVDNHRTIHSRTSFSDRSRWLLRVRMAGPCGCRPTQAGD